MFRVHSQEFCHNIEMFNSIEIVLIIIIINNIYKAQNTKVSKRYTHDTRKLKLQLNTLHLKLKHDKRYNFKQESFELCFELTN